MVARLRFVQGRLSEAERLCREYLEHIFQRDRRRYYTSGNLEIALAEVLLERNDLAAAEALAQEGLQQNKSWNIPQAILLAYLRLAQVQLAQGSLDAEETLQTAESFMSARALPPDLEHELRILHLTLDTARGRHISSQGWARDLPGEFSSDYRFENDYLLLARLLIAEKQFSKAAILLERLKLQAEAGQRMGRLIKILLLQALAYAALGRTADALDLQQSTFFPFFLRFTLSSETSLCVATPLVFLDISNVECGLPSLKTLSNFCKRADFSSLAACII